MGLFDSFNPMKMLQGAITPEMIQTFLPQIIGPELQKDELFFLMMSTDRKRMHIFKGKFCPAENNNLLISPCGEISISDLMKKGKEAMDMTKGMSAEDQKALEAFKDDFTNKK